ncbi:MAG: UDP-N-acetylmuramoyl-tripeptide--D-alanyl-D-alanine ligase [Pseudomonadota bacterium]|jgi:UDP-N-acetylmuramoyl-tripeptide--D-alanyl-D-alanine ligase
MTAMMSLGQAFQWVQSRLPGARLVGDASLSVQRVHTDSRSLQAGDLFVALRGERFDANAFLPQAKAAGAVAAIAHGGLAEATLSGIEVPHTTQALGALAAGWRRQFDLPVIAVTGSNGKTTVTQMIASILRAWAGEQAMATVGNFNNDIGVPLTLLRLRAAHRIAVVELGMNHPGEIASLASLAQPSVALVNNAQREHLEFMQTVQAVAHENGSVITALGERGVAVFPQDDVYTGVWQALTGTRQACRFGLQLGEVMAASAQWQAGAWAVRAHTPAGPAHYALHIAGQHNVKNSLAALACVLSAGVPLAAAVQGLTAFEPVKGRSRALVLPRATGFPLTLVDDSYNANPDSVRAAIDVLAALPGPRLMVLGDMGEVGEQGPAFHAEAGAYAHSQGIEQLMALGDLAQHAVRACPGARHFADIDALTHAVQAGLPQIQSALVKGSRFMKMERVVLAIQNMFQPEGSPC